GQPANVPPSQHDRQTRWPHGSSAPTGLVWPHHGQGCAGRVASQVNIRRRYTEPGSGVAGSPRNSGTLERGLPRYFATVALIHARSSTSAWYGNRRIVIARSRLIT